MIRQNPQPGDIGLTSIDGAVGRAIRLGQWLNGDGFHSYQHAFLVLGDGRLIEAMPGGARVVPLAHYDGKHVLYVSPAGLSYGERAMICEMGEQYEGIPYSGLDYFALAARRLRIPVPGLRRYIASTGHMICSQLVDQAYQDAGVHLFGDRRWPGWVTPGDLYQLLGRDAVDAGVPA